MGLSSWLSARVESRSDRRSVPDLLERLRDADDQVREDAANDLWGQAKRDRLDPGQRSAVEAALRLTAANDASPLARANALGGLVELGAADAVDVGLSLIRDDNWAARAIAASQLAKVEDPRVVDGLVPLLDDEAYEVCVAAAAGLGNQRDPKALEPLRELFRREHRWWGDGLVAETAKESIAQLERAESEAPD